MWYAAAVLVRRHTTVYRSSSVAEVRRQEKAPAGGGVEGRSGAEEWSCGSAERSRGGDPVRAGAGRMTGNSADTMREVAGESGKPVGVSNLPSPTLP